MNTKKKEPIFITYLECTDGTKLISLHRHDYRSCMTDDLSYHSIDGGQDNYIKVVGPGEVKRAPIQELIEQIREQFEWSVTKTKDNKLRVRPYKALLCDLETSHIENILKLPGMKKSFTRHYFEAELEYRRKPKALHTTVDGVELFVGSEYYFIDTGEVRKSVAGHQRTTKSMEKSSEYYNGLYGLKSSAQTKLKELEEAKKPKLLFVSEDGVNIFVGDTVYYTLSTVYNIKTFAGFNEDERPYFASEDKAWESLVKDKRYSFDELIVAAGFTTLMLDDVKEKFIVEGLIKQHKKENEDK